MKHMLIGVAALALASAPAVTLAQGNSEGKARAEQRDNDDDERGERSKRAEKREERGWDKRGRDDDDNREGKRGGSWKDDRERERAAERDDDDDDDDRYARKVRRDGSERAMRDSDERKARKVAHRDWSEREARRGGRVLDDGRRIFDRADDRTWWSDEKPRGLIDGCPPGLAKKNNGCLPPGLAKKVNDRWYNSPDWWGLGSRSGDGRFVFDDGYLLRLDGNRIASFLPLLGGALSIGNAWPDFYDPSPVPPYLADYFGLGRDDSYRYAENVLYRVDPETEAITSIAALLTGNDIRVGQPMPSGYDVYNVPYRYRSQYVDGPDAAYRYSDGYIYEVDPKTRLVAAAIELIAS